MHFLNEDKYYAFEMCNIYPGSRHESVTGYDFPFYLLYSEQYNCTTYLCNFFPHFSCYALFLREKCYDSFGMIPCTSIVLNKKGKKKNVMTKLRKVITLHIIAILKTYD